MPTLHVSFWADSRYNNTMNLSKTTTERPWRIIEWLHEGNCDNPKGFILWKAFPIYNESHKFYAIHDQFTNV